MSVQLDETSPAWQRAAHRLAYAGWFQNLVIAVIIANAVTIGLATYHLEPHLHHAIERADQVFLGVFVVELFLKLAAYRFRVRQFFSDPWNVFDFVVVAVCFIPGLSANTTALRLIRLLRVTRLIKLMPDVKVLTHGLRRALGPAASLLALTILLVYLYAVVGWIMFHNRTPEGMPGYFSNIGEAMLTLFELLTLEGWNSTMHDLRGLHPLALPYIISFLLIGTYIVINLVVGVVITSLDEAYRQRDREAQRSALEESGSSAHATLLEIQELMERLELLVNREHVLVERAEDRLERAEDRLDEVESRRLESDLYT